MNEPVIILHGGAGNILPHLVTDSVKREADLVLGNAIDLGFAMLHINCIHA